jgi:putative nucleotidyltransferase with HDIG domain
MDIARDVRTVRFLPAYFSTISHLLALLSQDEPSIPEIVQSVGTDQSLTSRLLTIVNSPAYGAVRQIGSIDEAVVRVGLIGLRNLTLAVSMNDITGGARKKEWSHSLAVANVADILSRKVRVNRDAQRFAYVTGLLHDIGKLFLSRRYMMEYQNVLALVNNGMPLPDAEKNIFGYDHAAVSGMLLSVWDVPPIIVDAIRRHHDPEQNPLAAVVYYAQKIICWKELPAEKRTPISGLGLGDTDLAWVCAEADAKVREMENLIH